MEDTLVTPKKAHVIGFLHLAIVCECGETDKFTTSPGYGRGDQHETWLSRACKACGAVHRVYLGGVDIETME